VLCWLVCRCNLSRSDPPRPWSGEGVQEKRRITIITTRLCRLTITVVCWQGGCLECGASNGRSVSHVCACSVALAAARRHFTRAAPSRHTVPPAAFSSAPQSCRLHTTPSHARATAPPPPARAYVIRAPALVCVCRAAMPLQPPPAAPAAATPPAAAATAADLKQRLEKKATFEGALKQLAAALSSSAPAAAAQLPQHAQQQHRSDLLALVPRVHALLRARYSNPVYWTAGLQLFQVAAQVRALRSAMWGACALQRAACVVCGVKHMARMPHACMHACMHACTFQPLPCCCVCMRAAVMP
jgi:hypothetical protein